MPKPQIESEVETARHHQFVQPLAEEEMNPLHILMASALSSGPILPEPTPRIPPPSLHATTQETDKNQLVTY